MAQLRQAVIEQIFVALDNDFFTAADFDVSFPDSGSEYVVINFRHHQAYSFVVKDQLAPKGGIGNIVAALGELRRKLVTIEAPGDYKVVEQHDADSFDTAISRIYNWCRNVRGDLRAKVPILDEFEELRQKFEKHIEEHITDPESGFSADELNRLSSRFDDLYKQFTELSEKHLLTEAELKAVKREFEIIKSNAAALPKGLWANLTKNRLILILKKVATSKEGRELMFAGAKKLLGLDGGQ